jgi:hypothetical protein
MSLNPMGRCIQCCANLASAPRTHGAVRSHVAFLFVAATQNLPGAVYYSATRRGKPF